MYDKIERLTTLSVARGVGFASLAVFCFMIGFAGDIVNFLRSGGIGALFIAIGLLIKARNSDARFFRKTEVWIMMSEDMRHPAERAAQMVTDARRLVLLRWSLRAASAAGFFLGAAVFFMLFAN
ncbi:MAG: hypothetical protein ACRCWF_12830 [Beijerinckiaceae bacterium]